MCIVLKEDDLDIYRLMAPRLPLSVNEDPTHKLATSKDIP